MTTLAIAIPIYFGVSLIVSLIYNMFLWKEYIVNDDRTVIECFLPCMAVWRITSDEFNLAGRIILATLAQVFLVIDTIMYTLITIAIIIVCLLAALFEFLFKKKDN